MEGSALETRSSRAWALARAQQWVVTRHQLLGLGFSAKAIEHRLRIGRLFRAARGVYLVGWNSLTPERRWMVAVLACGEKACLSHLSAAALWGIESEPRGRVDVTVRRRCELKRPGIRVHSRWALARNRVTAHRDIPVTKPDQTLIDIALELPMDRLERAVNEADKKDLIDPENLRDACDDHAGEPGVKPLRTLLDKDTFVLSDTKLEVLFRPIAAAAGLPPEMTKHVVNEYEVDFYWHSLGLVVETDGLRYHRTAIAQRRDAIRDNEHVASGYTRLRFTHWQVKYEPAYVRAILTRTAANLRRLRFPPLPS
jgi:hypothetical protein